MELLLLESNIQLWWKKAIVKLYSKSDMVYMMLELKYVLPLLLNP
jgi:hypothetical protein